MLLSGLPPLVVFSVVLIIITGTSAFDNSEDEVIEQDRHHDDYASQPSYFIRTSIHPFKRYWMNRPPTFAESRSSEGEIIEASAEERARMLNRFKPSNKRVVPIVDSGDDDLLSSRFLTRIQSKSNKNKKNGNSNAPSFFARMRNMNPLSTFMPCEATTGKEGGVCLPSPVCSFYGGRAVDGDCNMASSCCINEVEKCGALVTLNNTYWQAPAAVSSGSSCGLTVKLDENLVEQKKTICQIRLDFISFLIEQPNEQSVCSVDSFQVAGAINKVPVICGDNDGQHMYLTLPRDATSAQLIMTFGTSTIPRFWRIKIAMLPCDSDYLAPDECLQYFTSTVGSIVTFNWKDTTSRTTRQLANQDYYMCFRTELVHRQAASAQVATTLCLSHCQVSSGLPFSLSGDAEPPTSQSIGDESCSNDYIVFPGGYSFPPTVPVKQRDRFCGSILSQAESGTLPQTICSSAKPFRLLYRTNSDETLTPATDPNPLLGNQGFCLKYEQRLS
ncbi:uncharacterized protein LOC124316228 [Daphnia pulicaria]|uniref:uncharacterized protein LOC124316228 n=1 Tax=Daphnia pulicaria TaxID=35523 RepID=UPI001EE9CE90|nr:uncharacterized protein LOC124316228 [Daphnia pulicaria]